METIDITTAIGIATFIGVVLMPLKKIYKNKFNISQHWFGIVTIATALFLCESVSYIAYGADMIPNDTAFNAFLRGGQATFIAIGGYEGIKQVIELLFDKKVG